MGKKPEEAVKCVRSTVSIPAEQYEELQQIAEEKRVSVAWVVRDAVERYLAARHPLFPNGG